MMITDWAPEVAGKHNLVYDRSIDWWSLGCVIFEMYMGVSPFRTRQAKLFGGFDTEVCMAQYH